MQPVSSLPLPLILLIHLHILNYPRANEPQYDNHLFDGRLKGLKDRVKMMEDICYFLTGQLETSARNILPTYPCSQPSDTLAFRTSLFKYLETLRHRALFSSSSQKSSANAQKNKAEKDISSLRGTAWWWKDVVVRKSLLEECTGEKFERLLVSFSTHVLLHKSKAYTQEQLFDLAASASAVYSGKLVRYQSARQGWLQKASVLSQRRRDLELLKSDIIAQGRDSKLRGLPTDHLSTLAKVKRQDIHGRLWAGEQGSTALVYLLRLAGVIIPDTKLSPLQNSEGMFKELKDVQQQVQAPLLPIAAAHHPTELKRLRRSVIPSQATTCANTPSTKPGLMAQMLLSDDLLSAQRTHKRLSDALADIERAKKRFPKPESRKAEIQNRIPLWVPEVTEGRQLLRKPVVDGSLLQRLSLPDPESQEGFEQRIDYIRQHLLPPLPPPPAPHAPCNASSEPAAPMSQIPRLKIGTKIGQAASYKPPNVQPSKDPRMTTTPRKSIRASLAQITIKHTFEERKQMFEDKATKIILATEDDSTEDINLATPRPKALPNRIWTSGQKKTLRTIRRPPRRSSMLTFEEPLVALPLLTATSTGSTYLLGAEDDEETWEGDGVGKMSSMSGVEVEVDRDWEGGEGSHSSMTLRELLLAADTNDFELIDDEEEEYVEEFSGWA